MSFDLYIFDRDDVSDGEEVLCELLEDDARWGAPFTPPLAEIVAELERRYPGPDECPDDSPWASWPLTDSLADGTGVALNIVWSQSDPISNEVRHLASERGMVIYDPQLSVVIRPAPQAETRPSKRRHVDGQS